MKFLKRFIPLRYFGQSGRQAFFLLLLIFLSLFYFILGTYRNYSGKIEGDGKYCYLYLVSGYYDHDFDFTNNYRTIRPQWMWADIDVFKFRDIVNPLTGRPTNMFTVGPAILWAPFFLAANTGAELLNRVGFQIDVNPWEKFMQYAVMFSAVVYAVMALYFLYRLLILYFPEKISMGAIWLILISTNLFYYTVFESSMSHVYDLFTYALYLYIFVKSIKSYRLVIYLGLAVIGALHVLVRSQNIVTIILFSVLLVLIPLVSKKRFPPLKLIGAYGLTLFAGILPIPLINNYLFGKPFVIPQGKDFLNIANPHFTDVLFSPRNGLFSHHPILLVGLIGFVWFLFYVAFARFKDSDTGVLCSSRELTHDTVNPLLMSGNEETLFFCTMIVTFILQVYINSATSDWWGGHAFGQRRLISSFPLFAFGLAYIMQRIQRLWPALNIFGIIVFSIFGIYLTFIHVFMWDYNEPHNIITWMFFHRPY